jgi:hypothetical protein
MFFNFRRFSKLWQSFAGAATGKKRHARNQNNKITCSVAKQGNQNC